MHKASKRLVLVTIIFSLIAASCGGSDPDTPASPSVSTGNTGGTAASSPGPSTGLKVAGAVVTADIAALANDDAGMAEATAIFNEAGLDFNAAGLQAGFGSDEGEVRDSSLCRKVDAQAVGQILGMNLAHHPKPGDAPDQTRQPHLSCKLVDADSEFTFPVVVFFLSPVTGLENPDPDGWGLKWDAGGGWDDFVAVDGLGDFAQWMPEQTNLPERSVLYVEAGGGSAMIIGQVRDGEDWRPMNGPPLMFALAEIASAF